jgi:hypothetical protein
MTAAAALIDSFYEGLRFPEPSLLDKRIFKRMVLEHGELTASDKKILSSDVNKLTWKYTLKASTVQVLPYEDDEREYLEVAVVETRLVSRTRAARISEMIQRAIPYPVLLVLVDGSGLAVSAAHKRFNLAEKGSIVAEEFLLTPWMQEPLGNVDRAFCEALAFRNLSPVDFYALYRSIADAVLGRCCADLTGRFTTGDDTAATDRRARLDKHEALRREIASLRATLRGEERFAEKVELNTRIKKLEARQVTIKASL